MYSNGSSAFPFPTIAPLSSHFYRRVLDRIRVQTEAAGAEGFLVLDSHNLIYASGFFHRASERPMAVYVPVDGEPMLLVPHLEQENTQANWIANVRTYPEYPGLVNPILWMLQQTGARRLLVDTLEVRLFQEASKQMQMLEVSDAIKQLRFVKDTEELELVRAAASYADSCLEHMRCNISAIVAAGGTELDILQAGLGAASNRMKSEIGDAFDQTELAVVGSVHSGPRGALPHGHTTTRRPQLGDTIIAGIGATVGGYHAESGATFVLGEASADTLRCLKAAEACDAAACAALRPGISCQAVNEAAMAEFHRAGLGDFIRHRIGHGMGVQGHEGPWLAPGDPTIVERGMVFSNEPGIYRPGIDGYRTISTMIVGNGETEVPSRFQASISLEQRILAS